MAYMPQEAVEHIHASNGCGVAKWCNMERRSGSEETLNQIYKCYHPLTHTTNGCSAMHARQVPCLCEGVQQFLGRDLWTLVD